MDAIRIAAAVMVVFSHSFMLSRREGDPLSHLTGTGLNFGSLGVMIFFILSGFLIARSYDQSRDLAHYLRSRILRIYPALSIVVLLTVCLVGPLFTTDSMHAYFSDPLTYRYLETMTLAVVHYRLPGVFVRNSYPLAVNGSLWTLTYEMAYYCVVAALGWLRLLNRWVVLVLFGTSSVLLVLGRGGDWVHLFEYFVIGMTLYMFRNDIRLSWRGAVAAVAIGAACLPARLALQPIWLGCAGYLVLWASYHPQLKLSRLTRFGDLSYGTYIYAFIVQQSVTALYGGRMSWATNFALSLPITIVLAGASWFGIERRMLALKGSRQPQSERSARPPAGMTPMSTEHR